MTWENHFRESGISRVLSEDSPLLSPTPTPLVAYLAFCFRAHSFPSSLHHGFGRVSFGCLGPYSHGRERGIDQPDSLVSNIRTQITPAKKKKSIKGYWVLNHKCVNRYFWFLTIIFLRVLLLLIHRWDASFGYPSPLFKTFSNSLAYCPVDLTIPKSPFIIKETAKDTILRHRLEINFLSGSKILEFLLIV